MTRILTGVAALVVGVGAPLLSGCGRSTVLQSAAALDGGGRDREGSEAPFEASTVRTDAPVELDAMTARIATTSTSTDAPAMATPVPKDKAPGIACGARRCRPEQYCVETLTGGGVAPPPEVPKETPVRIECSDTLPTSSPGVPCMGPDARRHVHCMALIPAAAPPPPR